MKVATVTLRGITPYSQSQGLRSERGTQEPYNKYEERVWRERMNTDDAGNVVVPAMAIKNCLSSVAKYLGLKVPGKRGATYTKYFERGIYVDAPMLIGVNAEEAPNQWCFVPSDGKRGGGSRVWRCFPTFPVWGGTLRVSILDDMITEEVFQEHMEKAGQFIGIGRFRPESNGYFGRFSVSRIDWSQG